MTTAARRAAIAAVLAKWTPEALAATIVDTAAAAGSEDEWDSETIEYLTAVIEPVVVAAGLQGFGTASTAYWRSVTGD